MKISHRRIRFCETRRSRAILLLMLASVTVQSTASSSENHQSTPILQWITVSPLGDGSEDWGVSVLLAGDPQDSWSLEAGVCTPSRSPTAIWPSYRERVQGKTLTFFHVAIPCGNQVIAIQVSDSSNEVRGRISIPVLGCESRSLPYRVLVPEFKPGEVNLDVTESWVPLELTLENPEIVTLSIVDSSGQRVQSWGPQPIPSGSTTVLWDGRDRLGQLAPNGPHSLQVESRQSKDG